MRARDTAVPIAIAACAAFASPLHTPLNNPNEGVRVFAAKALVEHHSFAIDGVVAQWGYIDDKATRDGRLYSSKAPLVSLLAAAGYGIVHPFTGDLSREALTRVARVSGDLLPSLLMALLLWRGLRRRLADPVVADLTVVGIVLGSGVLASLNVLSGHALAALAPAAALVWARPLPDETVRGRRRRLALVGCALATAVGAEYPALLVAVPLGVLVLIEERRRDTLLWLALGALPVMLLVGGAHTAMFGAPWRTGYSFLENRQYQAVVAGTLFGVGAPDLRVLRTVLISPAVGLWFFSPVLAVGAAAALVGTRHKQWRAPALTIVIASVLMLLFIAGFRGWRGGWSVGPRYISELIGLWAISAAAALDRVSRARPLLARSGLAGLVAIGVLHSGVAGMFFPHLSDVFANPVSEMMLPLAARGFAPSSLPLWLGAGPWLASRLCLGMLALPVALALLGAGRRGLVVAALTALALVLLALAVDPLLASTRAGAGALEARRMMDNWRPERGNPVLTADPARNPRTLLAVDRARDAFPALLREGCAPPVAGVGVPRTVAGALGEAVARTPPGALLVVGDEHALALAELTGSSPVVALFADVERWRGPLPCPGPIFALLPEGGALPRVLAKLPVTERSALAEGAMLLRMAR